MGTLRHLHPIVIVGLTDVERYRPSTYANLIPATPFWIAGARGQATHQNLSVQIAFRRLRTRRIGAA